MDELSKAFSMIPPAVAVEVEYRLHYNSNGEIVECTSTQHPLGTEYIVVDKDTYDNYFRYCVVNKKLKKIDRNPEYSVKLKKSCDGIKVVKNNASIPLYANEEHADVEFYEYTN